MRILVRVAQSANVNDIRKKILDFKNVAYVKNLEENTLDVYYLPGTDFEQIRIEKIKELYNTLPDTKYEIITGDSSESFESKQYHFFLDIDHTLTDGEPGVIDNRAHRAFDEMKKLGHTIHFATGRDHDDTYEKIIEFEVSKEAIIENGGIISGLPGGIVYFGDIRGPQEALRLLKEKFGVDAIQLDPKQGGRITEIVILRNHSLEECTQVICGHASILESKRAFHLTKPGVNKGSALDLLASKARIIDNLIIAVGDSQLDSPMLKKAHIGFALTNSDKSAMDAADIVLSGGSYFDGVLYVFWKIDPRFDLKSYKLRYI